MAKILKLVQPRVSQDTVDMLRAALVAVQTGEAIGATLTLHYPGHHYSVDAAGAAKEHPTFTRGALCRLDDELAKLDPAT